MLLFTAMLFQAWGVEHRSFLFLFNPLLLSQRDAVSHGGALFLLLCVPNWNVLSETLSSGAESPENDRPRSARLAMQPEPLDEKMRSYPYFLL
jgi:hypothetical protein